MPKTKTSSSVKKRFKVTGTGKLRRLQVNNNHILEKKAPKRKRRLAGETTVAPGDAARPDEHPVHAVHERLLDHGQQVRRAELPRDRAIVLACT